MEIKAIVKLLVAEDNQRLLKTLVRLLSDRGYSVDGVSSGDEALEYAHAGEYDALILDVMMPGKSGLDVLRELRAEGCMWPALFLTARTEVYQRVEGLEAGADDYLPKPFATSELFARIEAMLRRRESFIPGNLSYAGVELSGSTFSLAYEGRRVSLSNKEYQIVELLMQRPETIVAPERILMHAWNWDADADTSSLWAHISNIRKKMQSIQAPLAIRFKRGAGYILEACAPTADDAVGLSADSRGQD